MKRIIILGLIVWGGMMLAACREQTPEPTPTPGVTPVSTVASSGTGEPDGVVTGCQPAKPAGWVTYTIQPNDSLLALAERRMASVEEIRQANCLASNLIVAGEPLYLPACPVSPPADWISITVRQDDTLSSLAVDYRTSVARLAEVNCLAAGTILEVGSSLSVPPPPTPTATSTATPTQTPVPPPPPVATSTPRPTSTLPLVTPTPGVVALGPPPAQAVGPGPGTGGNPAPAQNTGTGGAGDGAARAGTDADDAPAEDAARPVRPVGLVASLSRPADIINPDAPTTKLRTWADYHPCRSSNLREKIEEVSKLRIFDLGMRAFYYVCTSTTPTSATITFPDGRIQSARLLTETPHLDLPHPPADGRLIDLPIVPGQYPPDDELYKLTVFETSGTREEIEFEVGPIIRDRHILVLPMEKARTYQVYYTGFTPTLTHTFALYREQFAPGQASPRLELPPTPALPSTPTLTPQVVKRSYELVPGRWWTLPAAADSGTASRGWFTDTLVLTPGDREDVAYGIAYYDWRTRPITDAIELREPDWIFWPALLRR